MSDDGTQFAIDLPVTGTAGVNAAAEALDRLASQMTTAAAASTQAAEAVKAGAASYAQSESSANKAAVALEKIGLAADAQRGKLKAALDAGDASGVERATAKLAQLTARQSEAAAKAAATAAALTSEAAALDQLKAAAGAASDAEAKLTKHQESLKSAAAASAKAVAAASGSGKVNEIGEAFGKLGGPLGSAGQKAFGAAEGFKKMSGALGSAGPYVAIAVALVAVAAATAAAAVAFGAATLAILKFGIANADAARTAELLAIQAKGGAAGLAATAKLALSLDNQSKKLSADIGKIFSIGKPQLERFLEGLATLGALFDADSQSAKSIKVIFESLFNPLIDGITGFIPKLVAGFIQFEILVMKALIAVKPFAGYIELAAAICGGLALVVGGVLAVALGAVIFSVGMLAVGFALVVSAAVAVVAGIVWLGSAFANLGGSIVSGVIGAFNAVVTWLSTFSLASIGASIIDGLIAGITGAGGGVLTAITGIASGAVNAAKSLLGIASPSKVFAEIGMQTSAGMTEGVESGTGDVQGSLETMVAPPEAAGGAAAAPGSAGGGGGSPLVHIENLTIMASPGVDGKSFAEEFRDHLSDLIAQGGGGVPVTT